MRSHCRKPLVCRVFFKHSTNKFFAERSRKSTRKNNSIRQTTDFSSDPDIYVDFINFGI